MLRFVVEYSQKLGKRYNKKVTYRITTNGTLLDDEIIKYIDKYNIGVMVSLDGNKKLHDSQRSMKNGFGSYDLAIQGINNLLANKNVDVVVRCTMTHPVPELEKLIHTFEKFDFSEMIIGGATNPRKNPSIGDFTESDFEELMRQEELLIPKIIQEFSQREKSKYLPYKNYLHKIRKGVFSIPVKLFKCSACLSAVCIGPNGDIFPCSKFSGMGNWKIDHVEEKIDYNYCKEFWRNYQISSRQSCLSCWAYPICQGECPWQASLPNGSFSHKVRFCKYRKNLFERTAYISSKIQTITDQNKFYQANCI